MSISAACRWLNVPRRLILPGKRTGTPCFSSEPNASASAMPKSMRAFPLRHFQALLQKLFHLGMNVKSARDSSTRRFAERRQASLRQRPCPLRAKRRSGRRGTRPNSAAAGASADSSRAPALPFAPHPIPSRTLLDDRLGIGADFLRIDLPHRRMRFDLPVAQRLRDRGIVHFAVAVAAVADQVDHHRRAERVAIFERHPAHAHHRVGIFRVHVENRNRAAAWPGRKKSATSRCPAARS